MKVISLLCNVNIYFYFVYDVIKTLYKDIILLFSKD